MRDFKSKSGRPAMEKAICDNCGKQCEVPFKPTGDKPVYCSECFEEIGDKRFNKRSNGSGFGRRDQNRDSRNVEMYSATCDECGNNCEVPFKPTPGKPVFCSNCFQKKDDRNDRRDDRRSGDRRNDRRDDRRRDSHSNHRDNRDREMFNATCDECGKDCKIPFRPSNDKPVYCSDCFEKKNRVIPNQGTNYEGKSKDMKQLREQFDKLNQKVDDLKELLIAFSEGKKITNKKEEVITPESKLEETHETIEDKPKEEKKKPAKKRPVKKETNEEITIYETPNQFATIEPVIEETVVTEKLPLEPASENVTALETPLETIEQVEPKEELPINEPIDEKKILDEAKKEAKEQQETLQ